MQHRTHTYAATLEWTGNLGSGTAAYDAYSRNHQLGDEARPPLLLSSDPLFRGDPNRYSPEELLVASLSSCHMLWFLHLCAEAEITVTHYVDDAQGTMIEEPGGAGHFIEVVLRPMVTLDGPADPEALQTLHGDAHKRCFIARSVNFPVRCEPTVDMSPMSGP